MAASTDRTVLIAVDASENARNAFDWYLAQIHRPKDLVLVCHMAGTPHLPSFKPFSRYLMNIYRPNDLVQMVHIPETPSLPVFSFKDGMNVPVEEWRTIMEDQMTKLQKLQSSYETDLVSKKIPYKANFEQQERNPGQGIIQLAESEKADMIVMGTRGLDALRRTLLGSVSDYVIRHSSVPVIICPKK